MSEYCDHNWEHIITNDPTEPLIKKCRKCEKVEFRGKDFDFE